MDPLFHSVSGLLIVQMFPGNHVIAGVISANMPDLISFPAAFGVRVYKARKDSVAHFFEDIDILTQHPRPAPELSIKIYQYAHSLSLLFLFLIGYKIIFPSFWLILAIGHGVHLLSDIPSHQDGFATRLFYPFSNWHNSWGKNWTNNKAVFFGMWGLLIIFIIALYVILDGF